MTTLTRSLVSRLAALTFAFGVLAAPAQAAFVPSVTVTPGDPGFMDFSVQLEEEIPVVSMDVMIALPAGVFGPLPGEGTPLAATSSAGSAWEVTAFWPTATGGVSLLGFVTALPEPPDFQFVPIVFGPGENVFFFSLPLLPEAGTGPYAFTFVAGFDENFDETVTGEGTFSVVIPEPSTYALLLAGLVGLAALGRRRLAAPASGSGLG